MNQLIAKVRGRKKPHFFKLLSDKTVYDVNVSGLQLVDYEPDHNLDEGAWFKIENFSQQSYCIELLKQDFVSAEYDQIPSDKFKDIAYLCAVKDGDFYFQKITPSLFATRKTLRLGENVILEESSCRLFINTVPDAIYIKDKDTLVFRNLATISSVFNGIDVLYKEATKEDVKKFLDESFIELSNGYGVDKVSKPNRKRVALAMSTLADMSQGDRSDMLTYIHGYSAEKLNFDKNNGKFEIASDNELKHLLYGVEQRFYTTLFSHEKRLANSVQAI